MSACYLGLGQSENAFIYARLSSILKPSFVKSHIRMSKALVNLGNNNLALQFCQKSLESFPGNVDLIALLETIQKPRSFISLEDKIHAQEKKDSMSSDSISTMDSVMQNALRFAPNNLETSKMKKMIAIYQNVPDLAREFRDFLKKNTIPGLDIDSCLRLLQSEVDQTRAIYMMDLVWTRTTPDGIHPFLKGSICKVVGTNDRRKIEWVFSAPIFDVYVDTAKRLYESTIYHSFSNSLVRKERSITGKTHAAIGFVDFSPLLHMDLQEISGSEPFHFVGFEMSSFSVAKNLVIAAMLERTDVGIVDAILQVWYSSGWSDATVKLFRLSLIEAKKKCSDEETVSILRHWGKVEPPTLHQSRKEWLSKIDESLFCTVTNCSNLTSRNHLSKYFLTGQLLEASVGSICMFALPPDFQFARSIENVC
jgi:hypothetical protein